MNDEADVGQTRRTALRLLGATTVMGGLAVVGAQSAQAAVWPSAVKTISSSGTYSVDFEYYDSFARTLIWYRVSEGWSLTSTSATLNFITVKNLGSTTLYFSTFISADGGTPSVNISPFSVGGKGSRTFYPRKKYNKGPGSRITTQDIRGSTLGETSWLNAIEWRRK
jgi:hypothetical protein